MNVHCCVGVPSWDWEEFPCDKSACQHRMQSALNKTSCRKHCTVPAELALWPCSYLKTTGKMLETLTYWGVKNRASCCLLQNGTFFTSKAILEFIFIYLFDLDNATVDPGEEKVLEERTEIIHKHIDEKDINCTQGGIKKSCCSGR